MYTCTNTNNSAILVHHPYQVYTQTQTHKHINAHFIRLTPCTTIYSKIYFNSIIKCTAPEALEWT